MLFPTTNVHIQPLEDPLFREKQVSVSVLRLDKVHPVISGNKLFKLHYFLQQARETQSTGLITFGGAYSNHLVATAHAGKLAGLPTIGIVRGEPAAHLSGTLKACSGYGMEMIFISRKLYAAKETGGYLEKLQQQFPGFTIIPEGGYHPLGAAGAAIIMDFISPVNPTHICCAVGTATTVAGLLMQLAPHQQLLAFPVLKNLHDLEQRIEYLTNRSSPFQQLSIVPDYHFGGYAKKNLALLDQMNAWYQQHRLPTDFVYTAKMMAGVYDLVKKDVIVPESRLVCIHTGGLQGNDSLPGGSLNF